MKIEGQDLIDYRKSRKFSISVEHATTGKGFLTDRLGLVNAPTMSESGVIKERGITRKSAYSVEGNNSDHIKVSLEGYTAKAVKPRLFKLETGIDNDEMSLARFETEFNDIFSPAYVANSAMAESGAFLRGLVETSVEEMFSSALRTGQIGGKYKTDAGSTANATAEDFHFEAWQTGALTSAENFRSQSINPLIVLRKLKNTIKKNKGLKSKYLIMGSDVATILRSHVMTRNMMNTINFFKNSIAVEGVDGYEADYIGRLEGLECYEYFGSYTDADGNAADFFPSDGMLFAPSQETGAAQIVFGRVNREEVTTPIAYFLKRYHEEKKGFSSMLLETRVLPVIAHTPSFMFKTLPALSS